VRAVDSDRVGPPALASVWNYKIAMMAEEGSVVQQGAPAVMFDTTDLKRRLDEKTAERDSAATQLEMKLAAARVARQDEQLAIAEAEAELRKAKLQADAPEEITSVIDLEKARLDLQLAQKKVAYLQRKSESAHRQDEAEVLRWRSKRDRAESRVTEIGSAIEQMTIKAPRTGTVIYQTNWKGEKKKVGDSAWRAETILQLVALDTMEAEGEVDEVDASRVALDQPVSLRLDAQADVEVHGQVRKLSQTVQRASPENPLKVVRIDIKLEEDHDVPLRPGMRFRGRIETHRIEDVLLVPLDAVFATHDGPVVYRNGGGTVEAVPITLGKRNTHHVETTGGLREGDRILLTEEEAS
jgi:RND family efflux transporter MFP subunit